MPAAALTHVLRCRRRARVGKLHIVAAHGTRDGALSLALGEKLLVQLCTLALLGKTLVTPAALGTMPARGGGDGVEE
jgi:hypothetical protein